ncbi:heavy-metal-associated domain-containing protein [Streptomyces sp. NPDC012600]|uniref:Heavy-metal-associated domain-containing protein n=2 Tax=Streptomycetaceae TaxID=2062 RepID=A0ABU2VY08_9ACTN|nr:heavy-metal-associated domain-containing protein [Streptomyces griseus]ARF75941.1 transporter [Kitasatospora albolonga]MDT0490474.1 heavy-metal-associated domain-containing protein [Streptomyces griseus]
MSEKRYGVTGMTCGHCAASVTKAVTGLPGVDGAEVDLPGGAVLVRGEELDDAAIRAAVAEAGYTVSEPAAV